MCVRVCLHVLRLWLPIEMAGGQVGPGSGSSWPLGLPLLFLPYLVEPHGPYIWAWMLRKEQRSRSCFLVGPSGGSCPLASLRGISMEACLD